MDIKRQAITILIWNVERRPSPKAKLDALSLNLLNHAILIAAARAANP
jgi:hypothetical protein